MASRMPKEGTSLRRTYDKLITGGVVELTPEEVKVNVRQLRLYYNLDIKCIKRGLWRAIDGNDNAETSVP